MNLRKRNFTIYKSLSPILRGWVWRQYMTFSMLEFKPWNKKFTSQCSDLKAFNVSKHDGWIIITYIWGNCYLHQRQSEFYSTLQTSVLSIQRHPDFCTKKPLKFDKMQDTISMFEIQTINNGCFVCCWVQKNKFLPLEWSSLSHVAVSRTVDRIGWQSKQLVAVWVV